MPEYKLYYFDSRGRAEYIRYVLALVGVQYEDIRVSKDDWPELKESKLHQFRIEIKLLYIRFT